jgi:hypothetical protein
MKLNRRQSILVALAAAGGPLLAGAGGAVATAQLIGSGNTTQGRPASREAAPQGPPLGRAWREQRPGSGWAALRGRPDVALTSTDK